MAFDPSEIDYPALVESVERYASLNFPPLADPHLLLPSRFNHIWHPGEESDEKELEVFLEKIKHRAGEIEAKRPVSNKRPQYIFHCGMEAVVIVPEEGDEVIKLYTIHRWGDKTDCSKFIIDGTYQKDGDLEPDRIYYYRFRAQHHPGSTVGEALHNFAVSELWPLNAGGTIELHDRFLCVRQEKLVERATIPEIAEAVEKNRGIFLPTSMGSCPYLILTHDPRSQSLLLFGDMFSANFGKNRAGEVKAADVEGYRVETDDLARVGDLREAVWKLKENLERRGMDSTLPEEVERIIRRDETGRHANWPSLCLDKRAGEMSGNEMYERNVFCWR